MNEHINYHTTSQTPQLTESALLRLFEQNSIMQIPERLIQKTEKQFLFNIKL